MSINIHCEILCIRNYGFADFQDKTQVNSCILITLCTKSTEVFHSFLSYASLFIPRLETQLLDKRLLYFFVLLRCCHKNIG